MNYVAMETNTVWIVWNQVECEIQRQESVGWAVRQIVPAKQADSRSGVKDGFLVVFERRISNGREV